MTANNFNVTTMALVLTIFGGSDLFADEQNPRKALVEVTRNLGRMASESGYRAEIRAVGGLTEAADHRVDTPAAYLRVAVDVRGRLMHIPVLSSYIIGDKGAIDFEGHWRAIQSTRQGRAIQGMLNVPTDLLLCALKRGSQVTWKVPGRVLKVELAPQRSRHLFIEMNNSGCMRSSEWFYSRRESRIDATNTHGVLEIAINSATRLPESIDYTLMAGYRDDQGRVAKKTLAFQEGVQHVAFNCFYRLDTTAAVSEMRLSRKLTKLLK
ncbi:MAG: hypothetical protein AAEJ04_11830 [Planctomycetota bacterium]